MEPIEKIHTVDKMGVRVFAVQSTRSSSSSELHVMRAFLCYHNGCCFPPSFSNQGLKTPTMEVTIHDLCDDILLCVMEKLTMHDKLVIGRISKRFYRFVPACKMRIISEESGCGELRNFYRLAILEITICWFEPLFKLNRLFNVVSGLRLKRFTLIFDEFDRDLLFHNLSGDSLHAIQGVFEIPSLENFELDINQSWNGGVRDIFQAYLNSNRETIMRIELRARPHRFDRLIEPRSDSAFDYWIRIDNPEDFPFAPFLGKYRANDQIMQLNFSDAWDEKASILQRCTTFAEQNPERSFNLLFWYKWYGHEGWSLEVSEEDLETEDDFYKFNQNATTVRRYDRDELGIHGHQALI